MSSPPADPKDELRVSGPLPGRHEELIARAREKMRGRLAMSLVILLTLVIGAALALVGLKRVSVQEMKDFLEPILPPLVVLTGTALGFYFGGRRFD